MKAVLFDMDGVLIDTEKLYNICWRQASGELGFSLSDDEILSLRSCDISVAAPYFGGEDGYRAVRARRKELMAALIEKEGISLKKGADKVSSRLHEMGLVTAVVTATPLKRAIGYLEETGLRDGFDTVLSAKDVKRGKPFPDVYIHACEMLGLPPSECIAVEDSPNGLRSAHDAGLFTVMVPDLTPPDSETEKYTHAVAEDLDALVETVRKKL